MTPTKVYLAAITLTVCGVGLYLLGCRVVRELDYRRRIQARVDAIVEEMGTTGYTNG